MLKRLIRLIRDNITSIAAYPPFHVTAEIEEKLIRLSPATSDRLAAPGTGEDEAKGKERDNKTGRIAEFAHSCKGILPMRKEMRPDALR